MFDVPVARYAEFTNKPELFATIPEFATMYNEPDEVTDPPIPFAPETLVTVPPETVGAAQYATLPFEINIWPLVPIEPLAFKPAMDTFAENVTVLVKLALEETESVFPVNRALDEIVRLAEEEMLPPLSDPVATTVFAPKEPKSWADLGADVLPVFAYVVLAVKES